MIVYQQDIQLPLQILKLSSTTKNTMAGPAEFYSQSESDAFAWIGKFSSPRGVESQEHPDTSAGGGRSLEQPLFKQPAPRAAPKQSFALVWGQEESVSPPAAPSHSTGVIDDNLGDDSPFLALADMGYQFGVWAENRREGVNKISFAVARAPQLTHLSLAAWDHEHWSTAPAATTIPTPNPQGDTEPRHLVQGSNASSATQLTSSQQPLGQSGQNSRAIRSTPPISSAAQDDAFASENAQDENAGPSKRAALIAKVKAKPATSSAGILTSKSASQKRAALQKNRHRRPIYETAEPQAKAEEPKPATQQRVELRFDNTPEGHRTALNLAISQGLVDPDNDAQVEALMNTIRSTPNKVLKDASAELDRHVAAGGAVLGVINEDAAGEMAESSRALIKKDDGDAEAQEKDTSKTQRLKGKARKNAKKAGKK
jgi:hypothetical protein